MMDTYQFPYQDGTFEVRKNTRLLGTVETYQNPFHRGNCYLRVHLPLWDLEEDALSRELFVHIQKEVGKPLQVMVDSTSTQLVRFLLAGGFQCRRKCYERDFTVHDLRKPLQMTVPFQEASAGFPAFLECARLLYEQYREKHAGVNPLTATLEEFIEELPGSVLYQQEDGTITQFAFVEGNEIAYVGSVKSERYLPFLQTVTANLLEMYGRVEFEADDADPEAMALKALFADKDESSFDTYIR